MQLVNWFSHIVIFGSGTIPYLILENLPLDYANPHGHSMKRKAFLLPALTIVLSRPDEERQTITVDNPEPWEVRSGEPFSNFVRSLIPSNEVNDRYQGFVTGDIEFHTPLSQEGKGWIRDSYYHFLVDGYAVVRCTEIEFRKRLGYFTGNSVQTVPPWWS